MGLVVVSGCPRSGTSLMMDCLREIYGEENIIGQKFPSKVREEKRKEHLSNLPKCEQEYQAYFEQLMREKGKIQDEDSNNEDMNPNGFWEDGRFSVRGLSYRNTTSDIIEDIRHNTRVAKIVSQGLAKTDPGYIEDVIMMVRHPRAVAKSQERLRHEKFKTLQNKIFNVDDEVIHSPEMFIRVSFAAAKWFIKHKIEPLIVDYDDLISNPEDTLWNVCLFLKQHEGLEKAVKVVNPKLRRSIPKNIDNILWEESEIVYALFKEYKFEELIEYMSDPKRIINRKSKNWYCARIENMVNEDHCINCKNSKEFRCSLKEWAEKSDIPWRERPCAFEVAYDIDSEHITIAQSIENNFWEEKEDVPNRQSQSSRRISESSSIRQIWNPSRLQRRT